MDINKQIIKLSKGCPYSCPFCFNGKNDFEELPMPEIKNNYVILHDDAFLSKHNVIDVINQLGSMKINNKLIYYELTQGINLKDLNQDIANALKLNRFINMRFTWDGSYTKKSMFRVYDGIKMLEKAGYKRKTMQCFVLSNYYVSYYECMKKLRMLLKWGIQVSNCIYKKNYLDPKIYPEHWTMKEIRQFFTFDCREHSQIVRHEIDVNVK